MRYALWAACCALAISPWHPAADEVRDGLHRYHYRFDSLGGSDARPVRIAICPDPQCASPTSLATVRADTFSSPAPAGLPRPYFLITRGADRRIVGARRLALEGAFNFRDLGGFETTDGRRIRWGQVYRSDDLNKLTEADFKRLNAIGISLVCDLRWRGERKTSPTEWQDASPLFLLAPIGEDLNKSIKESVEEQLAVYRDTLRSITDRQTLFRQDYVETALGSAANIGAVIRAIETWDRPSLFHCAAGRDRTGITAAMLLRTLGVPNQTIASDFLVSDRYLAEGDTLAPPPPPANAAQARVEREFDEAVALDSRLIDTIFVGIDKRYGSFDAYRRDAMHITDADVVRLKARLLE
jgi:protein-tyrosine phosphatase